MPEPGGEKPAMSSSSGQSGRSFLGGFGLGIFPGSDTRTAPMNSNSNVDPGIDNPPRSLGSSRFRRVVTVNDFSKMAIPEESTDLASNSKQNASLAANISNNQSPVESSGGLKRRVSMTDFSKVFTNIVNVTTHGRQTSVDESKSAQPESGTGQRRHSSSVVWDWIHMGHSASETSSQGTTSVRRPSVDDHAPKSSAVGMGPKKLSYRDLNAYAPSNF